MALRFNSVDLKDMESELSQCVVYLQLIILIKNDWANNQPYNGHGYTFCSEDVFQLYLSIPMDALGSTTVTW